MQLETGRILDPWGRRHDPDIRAPGRLADVPARRVARVSLLLGVLAVAFGIALITTAGYLISARRSNRRSSR